MTISTYTPLEWALIYKTLIDVAKILNKNCPIATIIDREIAVRTGKEIEQIFKDKNHFDCQSLVPIDFDEKRTGIVRRTHDYNGAILESFAVNK